LPVSYRLPLVPAPGQDSSGAVDDGYRRPEEPKLGLPGSHAAAVIADVDGELSEWHAGDDRAQYEPCCQAVPPCRSNRVSVVLSDPECGFQLDVDTRANFVVDLRKER